jgi:hypothetical protein
VEAVLAFEELGRALIPGPLIGTRLAGGADITTVLDTSAGPLLVTHLDAAAVVAVLRDDVQLVAVAEFEATPRRSVDPLTPLHQVASAPNGSPIGDAATWQRDGALLASAYQVGIAVATLNRAVQYAKTREQFGRSIGSFQAVKHICADMLVRAELARVAVHAAAVSIADEGSGDPPRLIATAKLLADEAATLNSRAAVQVHGGMGFTWEVDVHLFLKRAWVLATAFGTAADHADALADLL